MWVLQPFEGEMASKRKVAKILKAAEATPFDLETYGAQHLFRMTSGCSVANLKSIGLNL